METQYDRELQAWNDLKKTHEYHANFGRTLLATSYALLESIPIENKRIKLDENTIDKLDKLSRQMIDKAVKIESDARSALLKLEKSRPQQI
jgi:hypothetical protein